MIAAVLIALVRVYQLTLSKLLLWTVGPVCRFEPSCSRYAVACLRDHGALRGSLLSAKRLCRCHPFHPGGYDPPPPAPPKGAASDHSIGRRASSAIDQAHAVRPRARERQSLREPSEPESFRQSPHG